MTATPAEKYFTEFKHKSCTVCCLDKKWLKCSVTENTITGVPVQSIPIYITEKYGINVDPLLSSISDMKLYGFLK